MRLWHKNLIPFLPRQQLLGQWRECCLIAKNLDEKGTPGHLLVDRILEYPIEHFWTYVDMVCVEMERRGYRCDFHRIERFQPESVDRVSPGRVFSRWHDLRYLKQCYANLEEKYGCCGVPDEEWQRFRRGFRAATLVLTVRERKLAAEAAALAGEEETPQPTAAPSRTIN